MTGTLDAVVLAGGGGRRLGGVDKAGLRLGGVRLLDRVLAALPTCGTVVVVGEERETVGPPVRWTREDPPGGGPAAGLVAALPLLTAEVVAVLAVDLPFLTPGVVPALLSALSEDHDGVQAVDADGRVQPLLAVYRTEVLRAGAEAAGDPDGLPVRRLLQHARLSRLALDGPEVLDCDTPEDLARARELLGRRG